MALASVFEFSAEKIEDIVWGFEHLANAVFGGLFSVGLELLVIFALIAGGMFVLYRSGEYRKLVGMLLTVLIALSYQIVVCFTFPDVREERYLWGPYTVMMFCVIWSMVLIFGALTAWIKTDHVRSRTRKICGTAAVILLIAMEWKMMDGGAQIAYLFHPDKDIEVLQEHKEIPWIVYGPTLGVYSYYDWLIPEKICFMSQYDTPEDMKAFEDFEGRERFVVYLHEGYLEQFLGLVEQEFAAEYESQFLTQSTELKVYLIKKSE